MGDKITLVASDSIAWVTYEYISLEVEEVKSSTNGHLQSPYSYMLKIVEFPCSIPGLFSVHHSVQHR